MNFNMIKNKIIILILLFTNLNAQNGFFVKFKDKVDNNVIESINKSVINKIATESGNLSNKNLSENIKPLNKYYYHKGEPVGRIFFVDFDDVQLNRFAKDSYLNFNDVEYTEDNKIYKLDYIPNDTYIKRQWALTNTRAFEAWEITKGSKDILIAIIDTGIDYLHQDLKSNIFINTAEDLNNNGILDPEDLNGIDDDNNGFTDDVIGFDFTDRVGFPFSSSTGDYTDWDHDPMDEYGHGTWVAGVIGAVSNNNEGITGFVPNTRILNVRAFDPTGNGEEDDAAAAILYAVQMGAKVINMSFGDSNFSFVLRDVIRFAYDNGVVLVGSAGNSSSTLPHYPSSYPEVISCGATDNNDYLASFSNTGSTIDLVAPGVNLFTTDRNNEYRDFSGTSSSAPVVSSAAALLLSIDNFTPEEVKQILKSTAVDLGQSGWDEKFGSGRIDILSALSIKAPSIIKINSPKQDFETKTDFYINASILSGSFESYDLQYGYGYNPTEWINLIEGGKNQFINRDIYKFSIKDLPDSVYCLRLKVLFKNGLTTEERVNFYIIKKARNDEVLTVAPAYYGNVSTILASMYTESNAATFMHYRKQGEAEFKVIALDGFSTNNMFYKQLHYGFIPLEIASPNTTYEIYFQVKRLTGDGYYIYNEGSYFTVKTDEQIINKPLTEQIYSLPYGRISEKAYKINGIGDRTVFLNSFENSSTLRLYNLNINGSFSKIDSIKNRQVPKSVGDYNNNGKIDILSYFYPKAIIDEQIESNSTKFNIKFVDSSAVFRPILIDDINNDLKYELLALTNDTTISVYRINSDLNIELMNKVYNFSPNLYGNYYKNSFGSPSAVITNGVSGTNQKELWLIDSEGDILCYFIESDGNLRNGITISTGLNGLKNLLSTGDFDGDGQNDIGVLLDSEDIPFKLLLVFNIKNSELNIITERFFIDPSLQFSSLGIKPKANIKFAKLFNQNNHQLLVNTYPYSFVFDCTYGITKGILFSENNDIKANEFYFSTFTSDLNSNGVNEFVLPINGRLKFFEFNQLPQTPAPIIKKYYNIGPSKAYLSWISTGSKTYIYRGLSEENIVLYDSTFSDSYLDSNLANNTNYYYKLQSYSSDNMFNYYSDLTTPVKVYTHDKVIFKDKKVIKGNSLLIEFSGKINTAILNLHSFLLFNWIQPSSISVSSEKSYLISFSPQLQPGNYTLNVKDVYDSFGSPIDSFEVSFSVESIVNEQSFYITDYRINSSKEIVINFNMDLDTLSFFKLDNYIINPFNSVEKVDIIASNSVVLKFKYPITSTGITYTIKLKDMKSSPASGNLNILEGAGSYLVISTNAANLSDMYVFPNPFNINESDGTIYFANIPKKTDIIIFDIKGKKIAEISERDGNGGVNWDLRNYDGEKVSSGVYLYRAAVIDDNNNEIEVKMGKFAITR